MKIKSANHLLPQTRAMGVALLAIAVNAFGASGTWNNPLGGSWATAANWQNNVIATGSGSIADFSTLALTSPPAVTLGGAQTVGNLIFGDRNNAYGWLLNTNSGGVGTLTLQTASGLPTVTVNNQTATIGAVVAGTQGLVKEGAGTLLLTNANTYTGGTTVSNGLLMAGGNGGNGTSFGPLNAAASSVIVEAGATVDLNGQVLYNGMTIAGSGTSGQGALINNGASLGTGLRMTPNITLADDATVGGSGDFRMVFQSYGADTLTMNGHTLTKVGANNFYICNTTVAAGGTIVVNGGAVAQYHTACNAAGTAFVLANSNGAALNLNSLALSVGSLTGGGPGGGNVVLGSGTLTVGGDNTSPAAFAGNISGAGGLIKTGTGALTLSGANSYGGATTVSNGLLVISGSLGSGPVTAVANGTLEGVGTIGGPVTINAGGTLEVGGGAGVGTLTVANTLALSASSTNLLRITKTGGMAASDAIVGLTGVTFGGTLIVTNVTSDGTPLALGDTFVLFTASGPYNGGFSTIVLPALPAGLSWNASQLAVSGVLSVINSAATPVFNPASGGYLGAQSVTLSCLTPGATIYYTTNGTTPTLGSLVYASPITVPVNSTITIEAFAHATGYSDSAVASATYATETEAVWTNVNGGSWAMAANWTNGIVPNASGATVDFSQLTLPASLTITLDSLPSAGNLVFGDAGNLFAWEIDAGTGGPLTLTATNTPTVAVLNQAATIGAVVAGTNGLAKTGAGLLKLSAPASYTGDTVVAGGTLELAGNNGWNGRGGTYWISNNAVLQVDNAVAQYNVGDMTVVNVAGGGQLVWNSANGDQASPMLNTVNLDSSDGSPAIVNTTAGNSAPRFGYGANGLITSSGTVVTNMWNGNIILENGSGYTLTVSNNAPLLVSGSLYDFTGYAGEPLIKTGGGTLVLAGSSSYAGPTTVNGGTLEVDGSMGNSALSVATNGILTGIGTINGPVTVQMGGTLAVGGTVGATLNLANTLTLNPGGEIFLRLDKTGGVTANDQFGGLSGVHYGGTLVLTNITSDSTPLAPGDRFTLFNAASFAGVFNAFILPIPPSGLSWDVSQLAVNGSVAVSSSASAPIFNPAGAIYFGSQPVVVTISSLTPGATIYYTTDGSAPSSSSPSGLTPVTVTLPVNTNLTIQAYAHVAGQTDSAVVSANYVTEAEAVWTSAAGGSWSTAGDWTNGIIPNTSGVTADFSMLTLAAPLVVTLDGPWTAGNLVFGDAGNNYGSEVDTGGSGALTLAGTNSPTITVLNQSATIKAVLAGTNGLSKTGPGTLILAGGNTFSGGTFINGGVVVNGAGSGTAFGAANTTPSAVTINGGATLDVNGGALYYGLTIAGSGTAGQGALVNNGAAIASNLRQLPGLALSADAAIGGTGNLYMIFSSYGPASLNLGGHTLTKTGANVFDLCNTTVSGGGAIAIAGGIVGQSNTGNNAGGTAFSLANTAGVGLYLYDLPLSIGSLTGGGANGGGVNLGAGTLTVGGDNTTPPAFAGVISGTGGLIKLGAGTLTLSASNLYSGATIVSNGAVLVNGSINSSVTTVQSGGVLGGSGSVNGAATIQTGGAIQGGDAGGSNVLNVAVLNLGIGGASVSYSRFLLAARGAIAAATLNVSGTNVINITDSSLSRGTNTLFTYAGGAIGGASGFGGFQLAALPPGVTAHLIDTGSAVQLGVTAVVATNPPVLTAAGGLNGLTLSWPADHTGWRLEVQTNSLGSGLGGQWFTWPGSTNVTSVPISVDTNLATVFFRLVFP